MPLLGRAKTSSSQREPPPPPPPPPGDSRAGPRQQVCESPLFGLRQQLGVSNEVPKQISRQQIHYAFAIMDSNRDGVIDVRELSQMLANLGVPIDEAVLAHIMASASKRGDHRMSEDEFLAWISEVVQVSDCSQAARSRPRAAASGRSRQRQEEASGARSTLAAAGEAPLLRNRRGSGSGLALMRSLSGPIDSAAAAAAAAAKPPAPDSAPATPVRRPKPGTASQLDQEAREDLKAAFGVFDLDGDGFITLDEVRAGLKLLGESWSPDELRQVFARCSSSSSSPSSTQQDLTKSRISIDDFVQLLL